MATANLKTIAVYIPEEEIKRADMVNKDMAKDGFAMSRSQLVRYALTQLAVNRDLMGA